MHVPFVLLALLVRGIHAQPPPNSFIVPQQSGEAGDYSHNLAWPLSSTQTVIWVSNFSSFQLFIFQDNHVANGDPMLLTTGTNSGSGQQQTSFTWEIATMLNFVTVPVFWFELYEGTNTDSSTFNSHYFNITSPSSSSTSSLSPSTSSSASTSTSTSTSSTALAVTSSVPIASPSTSITSTPTPDPGLSLGAKIGIGVGVPLAVLAIVLASFLLWKRSRRGHKEAAFRTSDGPQHQTGTHPPELQGDVSNWPQPLYTDGKPELSGDEVRRYELGDH